MVPDASTETLNRLAIESALQSKWADAQELNLRLLEVEPQNTEYLNRLAKCHFEQGKYSESKKVYNQVLAIDPYNTIAQKNLKKVSAIKKADGQIKVGLNPTIISPDLFYEEPGITTLVNLVKVAEPQKLISLSPGTLVTLNVKKRGISVTDANDNYLGAFPDDSSFHLIRLLDGGNKYQVIVKSVKANSIVVIVRETFRSKKFKNQASFLQAASTANYADNIPFMGESSSDDSDDSGGEEAMP